MAGGNASTAALMVLLVDGLYADNFCAFKGKDPLVGSWAGNVIVLAGDEAYKGQYLTEEEREAYEDTGLAVPNLYDHCGDAPINLRTYRDISDDMRRVLALDSHSMIPQASAL